MSHIAPTTTQNPRPRPHKNPRPNYAEFVMQICDEGNWRETHRIARVASKILGGEITAESARKSMLSLGSGRILRSRDRRSLLAVPCKSSTAPR
jgi:hypothetical protein